MLLQSNAVFTKEDLKQKPCALPSNHPSYQPPTPQDIADLTKLMGWSQTDVAKLTGVNFNPKKGSITVRRWKAKPESNEHRAIPYAAWRLLLILSGVANINEDIEQLEN